MVSTRAQVRAAGTALLTGLGDANTAQQQSQMDIENKAAKNVIDSEQDLVPMDVTPAEPTIEHGSVQAGESRPPPLVTSRIAHCSSAPQSPVHSRSTKTTKSTSRLIKRSQSLSRGAQIVTDCVLVGGKLSSMTNPTLTQIPPTNPLFDQMRQQIQELKIEVATLKSRCTQLSASQDYSNRQQEQFIDQQRSKLDKQDNANRLVSSNLSELSHKVSAIDSRVVQASPTDPCRSVQEQINAQALLVAKAVEELHTMQASKLAKSDLHDAVQTLYGNDLSLLKDRLIALESQPGPSSYSDQLSSLERQLLNLTDKVHNVPSCSGNPLFDQGDVQCMQLAQATAAQVTQLNDKLVDQITNLSQAQDTLERVQQSLEALGLTVFNNTGGVTEVTKRLDATHELYLAPLSDQQTQMQSDLHQFVQNQEACNQEFRNSITQHYSDFSDQVAGLMSMVNNINRSDVPYQPTHPTRTDDTAAQAFSSTLLTGGSPLAVSQQTTPLPPPPPIRTQVHAPVCQHQAVHRGTADRTGTPVPPSEVYHTSYPPPTGTPYPVLPNPTYRKSYPFQSTSADDEQKGLFKEYDEFLYKMANQDATYERRTTLKCPLHINKNTTLASFVSAASASIDAMGVINRFLKALIFRFWLVSSMSMDQSITRRLDDSHEKGSLATFEFYRKVVLSDREPHHTDIYHQKIAAIEAQGTSESILQYNNRFIEHCECFMAANSLPPHTKDTADTIGLYLAGLLPRNYTRLMDYKFVIHGSTHVNLKTMLSLAASHCEQTQFRRVYKATTPLTTVGQSATSTQAPTPSSQQPYNRASTPQRSVQFRSDTRFRSQSPSRNFTPSNTRQPASPVPSTTPRATPPTNWQSNQQQTGTATSPVAPKASQPGTTNMGNHCFKCGALDHYMRQCPLLTEADRQRFKLQDDRMAAVRAARAARANTANVSTAQADWDMDLDLEGYDIPYEGGYEAFLLQQELDDACAGDAIQASCYTIFDTGILPFGHPKFHDQFLFPRSQPTMSTTQFPDHELWEEFSLANLFEVTTPLPMHVPDLSTPMQSSIFGPISIRPTLGFHAVQSVAPTSKANSSLYMPVHLEGMACPLQALIDSGAECNIISKKLVDQLQLPLHPSQTQLRVASGEYQRKVGVTRVPLSLEGMPISLKCEVMDSDVPLIVGMPFLTQYDSLVRWRERLMIIKRPGLAPLKVHLGVRRVLANATPVDFRLVNSNDITADAREEGSIAFLIFSNQVKAVEEATIATTQAEFTFNNKPADRLAKLRAETLTTLQNTYPTVFQDNGLPPDRPGFNHNIVLTDPNKTPARPNIYPLTPRESEELNIQLRKLLGKGLIRHSNSPYAAPILFVKKANGELRMCIDYRKLNDNTVMDAYPMPRADHILDSVGGAQCFSRIDLQAAFWQLRVNPEDVQKTAFRTATNLYEWVVMPFGMQNSPASFQRFIDEVIKDHRLYCRAYIDDLLIFSKTEEEHTKHLNLVFQALAKHQLSTNEKKCELFVDETTFLGHTITTKGLRKLVKKEDKICGWPTPTSVKELQAFLGFTNYVRRFIRNYADIAVPLNALTKKSVTWKWGPAEQTAFDRLKTACSEEVVLAYPNYDKTFYLYTDASTVAIGAALQQYDEQNHIRPVAYYSRSLSTAERNYSTHEREALAIIEAIRHWRHYLDATKFIVKSDHASLTYLMTQHRLNPRQMGWQSFLANFSFEIQHISGSANTLADSLSRVQMPSIHLNTIGVVVTPTKDINRLISESLQAIVNDPSHPGHKEATNYLKNAEHTSTSFTRQGSDIVYKNTRLYVPPDEELRYHLFCEFHNTKLGGHFGRDKTASMLSRLFFWPNLTADVTRWCAACTTCQLTKVPRRLPTGLLKPLPIPEGPLQSVHIDFVTHLPESTSGNNTIMVSICRFTKVTKIAATTHKYTSAIAAELFFDSWVRHHGYPKQIVSDRDPKFVASLWRTLCEAYGTSLSFTSGYHPQTNGQVERCNQTIIQLLRCFLCEASTTSHWESLLPTIELCINTHPNASTKQSPFRALHGVDTMFPLHRPLTEVNAVARDIILNREEQRAQITQCLKAAQDLQAYNANRRRRHHTYVVEDEVLVATKVLFPSRRGAISKVDCQYQGPYTVTEVINDTTVRLALPSDIRRHPVFHISGVKPANTPHEEALSPRWAAQETVDSDEVESIIGHECYDQSTVNVRAFLVRWKNQEDVEASWIWAVSLRNIREMLMAYCLEHHLRCYDLAISVAKTKDVRQLHTQASPSSVPATWCLDAPDPENLVYRQTKLKAAGNLLVDSEYDWTNAPNEISKSQDNFFDQNCPIPPIPDHLRGS